VEFNDDGLLSTVNPCEEFASISPFQCGGADREPYTTSMIVLEALTELLQQDFVSRAFPALGHQ
jgi:hypothetical protein